MPLQHSDTNKAVRVAIAGIVISKTKNSGFCDSFVTLDKEWILYENTTRKRRWLSPVSFEETKAKPDIHERAWWDSRGLVHFEVLSLYQTVTADLHKEQLSRVNQALCQQGVTATVNIFRDNARPHAANITLQKIEGLGWELLPHPPCSPDHAASDYHRFRSMQPPCRRKKFKNRVEVEI